MKKEIKIQLFSKFMDFLTTPFDSPFIKGDFLGRMDSILVPLKKGGVCFGRRGLY